VALRELTEEPMEVEMTKCEGGKWTVSATEEGKVIVVHPIVMG
jgi:hypothetical protein